MALATTRDLPTILIDTRTNHYKDSLISTKFRGQCFRLYQSRSLGDISENSHGDVLFSWQTNARGKLPRQLQNVWDLEEYSPKNPYPILALQKPSVVPKFWDSTTSVHRSCFSTFDELLLYFVMRALKGVLHLTRQCRTAGGAFRDRSIELQDIDMIALKSMKISYYKL